MEAKALLLAASRYNEELDRRRRSEIESGSPVPPQLQRPSSSVPSMMTAVSHERDGTETPMSRRSRPPRSPSSPAPRESRELTSLVENLASHLTVLTQQFSTLATQVSTRTTLAAAAVPMAPPPQPQPSAPAQNAAPPEWPATGVDLQRQPSQGNQSRMPALGATAKFAPKACPPAKASSSSSSSSSGSSCSGSDEEEDGHGEGNGGDFSPGPPPVCWVCGGFHDSSSCPYKANLPPPQCDRGWGPHARAMCPFDRLADMCQAADRRSVAETSTTEAR